MGIFKRISDIISANLGELAEKYEDPEKMLKQAIREMEESIGQATRDTAKTIGNEKRLQKELAHNESEANRWQDKAELAVSSGDDDLARKALGRKREHDKLAAAIRDQVNAVSEANDTLKRQLEAMKAKLAEAKRNLATLSARQKAAKVRQDSYLKSGPSESVNPDNSAFQKFDRLKEKVEMAEAEADALAELCATSASDEVVSEIEETDDDIERQLKGLKHRQARG